MITKKPKVDMKLSVYFFKIKEKPIVKMGYSGTLYKRYLTHSSNWGEIDLKNSAKIIVSSVGEGLKLESYLKKTFIKHNVKMSQVMDGYTEFYKEDILLLLPKTLSFLQEVGVFQVSNFINCLDFSTEINIFESVHNESKIKKSIPTPGNTLMNLNEILNIIKNFPKGTTVSRTSDGISFGSNKGPVASRNGFKFMMMPDKGKRVYSSSRPIFLFNDKHNRYESYSTSFLDSGILNVLYFYNDVYVKNLLKTGDQDLRNIYRRIQKAIKNLEPYQIDNYERLKSFAPVGIFLGPWEKSSMVRQTIMSEDLSSLETIKNMRIQYGEFDIGQFIYDSFREDELQIWSKRGCTTKAIEFLNKSFKGSVVEDDQQVFNVSCSYFNNSLSSDDGALRG